MYRKNVFSRGRRDLSAVFAWQLHRSVSDWVRFDTGEIERLRERRQRLANRLARKSLFRELADEAGDVDRAELGRGPVTDAGEDAREVHVVGGRGPSGDVDARRTPSLAERADRLDARRPRQQLEIRDAHRGELAGNPIAAQADTAGRSMTHDLAFV